MDDHTTIVLIPGLGKPFMVQASIAQLAACPVDALDEVVKSARVIVLTNGAFAAQSSANRELTDVERASLAEQLQQIVPALSVSYRCKV